MKSKDTRISIRISEEEKFRFEQAAEIGGYRSLSDFLLSSSREKAEDVFAQHEKVLRSDQDRELFFNELISPTDPNERLKKAAALLKK